MKCAVHKTKGGLIRVTVDADDRINDIRITGDFFIYPEESVEALEKALVGVSTEEAEILKVVKDFYENIEGMDISAEDIVNAIKKAL